MSNNIRFVPLTLLKFKFPIATLFGILLSLDCAWASGNQGKGPVESLLMAMSEAGNSLNYRGLISYEHGGVLTSIRLVHAMRNGKVYERIEHLNGPYREFIRRDYGAGCIKGEEGNLKADSAGRPLLAEVDKYYRLIKRADNRIANRAVSMVYLMPKDQYRFGQMVAVDKQTNILLQTLLMDVNKRVLERFQYIEFELGTVIDDRELEAMTRQYHAIGADVSGCVAGGNEADETATLPDDQWLVGWLPPGFSLITHLDSSGAIGSERLYSDGIAAFSIFFDRSQWFNAPPTVSRRGASILYMASSAAEQHHTVAVVGEIPLLTARRIVESVSVRDDSGREINSSES